MLTLYFDNKKCPNTIWKNLEKPDSRHQKVKVDALEGDFKKKTTQTHINVWSHLFPIKKAVTNC